MFKLLISFAPFALTILAVGLTLWSANWLLIRKHPDLGNERKFPRQLTMLGLTLIGILVILLALPINQSLHNQLIGLFGIAISGMIAFSSTTIISNLMAGVLLRITQPFAVGDFIRIGEHFGRVSERGLFDTEIQTETRELISLPNTYCIANPLARIRSSGTIISASLSLGYEIDRNQIESLLLEAAQTCGLKEPFVHILELGNFSVTYRVSGFLEEAKRLISVQSNLYGCVLDTLHGQGIEIMSPSYMNQRQIGNDARAIPQMPVVAVPVTQDSSAEEIAFDKAEQAEKFESEKLKLEQEIKDLENYLKETSSKDQKKIQQEVIAQKRNALKLLEEASDSSEKQAE